MSDAQRRDQSRKELASRVGAVRAGVVNARRASSEIVIPAVMPPPLRVVLGHAKHDAFDAEADPSNIDESVCRWHGRSRKQVRQPRTTTTAPRGAPRNRSPVTIFPFLP